MNLTGVCKLNVGPTGGETFTVTCFACGMPSSKEWAQRVRSRPNQGNNQEPFFPLLSELGPMEDGSVYLCAFCHALLEAQWNNYETKGVSASVAERIYNVNKFICAVCAVETYRKRVRALPFQEFPFLIKQRQPGSITLGNNPLAVVCLDCSETLWAQSAEYDRWGLPIHKRHFNWMARPPPPEDSMEATVARLPSGETQLPRCPPTDPLVPPKTNEPTALPEAIPPVKPSKYKTSGASHKHEPFGHSSVSHSGVRHHHQIHQHQPDGISHTSNVQQNVRKISLGATSSHVLDIGGQQTQQPPVVTVAPMTTHHTLTNTRKDLMSSYQPNVSSSHHKYEIMNVTQGGQPLPNHGPTVGYHADQLFHQTPLFSPSGSYPSPFPWPSSITRDGHSSLSATEVPNHNPFGHYGANSISESHPNPPTWPWLPPASPELLRYQSYISSLQNRSRLSEAYYASPSALYPQVSSSSANYLPPLQVQNRIPSPPIQSLLDSSLSSSQNLRSLQHSSFHEFDQPMLGGSSIDHRQFESLQRTTSSEVSKTSSRTQSSKASKSLSQEEQSNQEKVDSPKQDSSPERLQSKSKKKIVVASECSSSNRRNSFLKIEQIPSSHRDSGKRSDALLPKKRHWQPSFCDNQDSCKMKDSRKSSHIKKQFSLKAVSETVGRDNARSFEVVSRKQSLSESRASQFTSPVNINGEEASISKCAMDLTVTSSIPKSRTSSSPASSKFSIAYLSKSESLSLPTNAQGSSRSGRSSVIVSIPNKDVADDEQNNSSVNIEMKGFETNSELITTNTEEMEKQSVVDETVLLEEDCVLTNSQDLSKIEQFKSDDENVKEYADSDKEEHATENTGSKGSDETQIHMVTIEDIRIQPTDYVRKTIEDYVSEEKRIERTRKESLNKQLSFLNKLGLITPEKKLEIEIETLAGRSEKNTIPPIRMRVKSPSLPKLDEVLEQQLLEVAFNDPSLRHDAAEPEKTGFLQNLGLKPCTKMEKSRREIEWRLVLTERLMRQKRDEKLRGVKRTWDTYDKVSKLLCLPERSKRINSNSEYLPSLSLTLPPEMEKSGIRRNSSDLLTTVETSHTVSPSSCFASSQNVPTATVTIKKGVCINYPKYIPSYVLTAHSKDEDEAVKIAKVQSLDETKALEILNVPSLHSNNLIPTACGSEPILRIPVVSSLLVTTRRRSSNSTLRTTPDDSDADLMLTEETAVKEEKASCEPFSSFEIQSRKTSLLPYGPPEWSEVDMAVKVSAAQWEKTKKIMEKFSGQTNYLNSKESKKLLEERAAHYRGIRKHLKSQQADMRLTEKFFKGKEKQIIKKLRTLTKYSYSKETSTTKNQ